MIGSQTEPYNKYLPIDPTTISSENPKGNRSYVGCSFLAIGQIINYWRYPRKFHLDNNRKYITQKRNIRIDEDYMAHDFLSFEAINEMLNPINYDDPDDSCTSIFYWDYVKS